MSTKRALRRKLHAWELLHLREHVEELRQRVEALESENAALQQELRWLEDLGQSWRDEAMSLVEQAQAGGQVVALTQDGRIAVLPAGHA